MNFFNVLTSVVKSGYQVEPSEPSEPPLDTSTVMNAFQGAVTHNEFTVAAKLVEEGSQTLKVYSNAARTQLVTETSAVNSGDTNEVKITANNLTPNTQYYWDMGGFIGKIRTLPQGQSNYKVVMSNCAGNSSQSNPDLTSNHEVFDAIWQQHPDSLMFFHLGDIHYRDIGSNSPQLFDTAFDDVLENERQQNLYRNMALTYIYDDHDYGANDSNGGSQSRPAVISTYHKRIPHYPLVFEGISPITQSFVIGRVRYIMLDVRADRVKYGTVLGETQKQWLKNHLLEIEEPLICLSVGVPWIVDADDKVDTWANSIEERDELLDFFEEHNLVRRMFIVAGDAHMTAMDDGTNNRGIPFFHFGSLDAQPSYKGGPYSHGGQSGIGQFGTIEIVDNGTNIGLNAIGYKVEGDGITTIMQLEKEYDLSSVDIYNITEGQNMDSGNFTVRFNEDSSKMVISNMDNGDVFSNNFTLEFETN